jgi:oligosaccharide reducing-end xylanase
LPRRILGPDLRVPWFLSWSWSQAWGVANGQAGAVETNHGAAVTGNYRNLFVEAGHTPQEVSNRLAAAVQQLFHGDPRTQAVYFNARTNQHGAMAFIYDVHSRDVRTEGMSYGMMVAVQLNRQSEFDALWNWAKSHMQHTSAAHPAWGYFSWSVQTNGVANDEMPAPDGEEYFATALYFASGRWGNRGPWNYRAEADQLLTDLRHRQLITGKTVKGIMTAGAIFEPKHKMVRFTPDVVNWEHTDPLVPPPRLLRAVGEVGAGCGPCVLVRGRRGQPQVLPPSRASQDRPHAGLREL